jgi:hypothetical protein
MYINHHGGSHWLETGCSDWARARYLLTVMRITGHGYSLDVKGSCHVNFAEMYWQVRSILSHHFLNSFSSVCRHQLAFGKTPTIMAYAHRLPLQTRTLATISTAADRATPSIAPQAPQQIAGALAT